METEREKMISGKEYNPKDLELAKARQTAHQTAHMYNQIDNAEAREHLLQELFGTVDETALVEPGLRVDYGFNIHVGKKFYANFNCIFLDVCPITFGDNVMIGTQVSFVTAEHPLEPERRNQGIEFGKPITVGNNVWIGSSVTITGGVTLGENVVVGAGSVVTKSFGDDVLIAGNPARVIRKILPG